MTDRTQNQPLRAPQADGQTLVDPPRSTLPDLIARNRRHIAELDYDIQGRSLSDLAVSARRSLVVAAEEYTGRYRQISREAVISSPDSNVPLVLSGHQPQLFHPGVWYKNFVLGRLAQDVGGVGIHLLIDSDLCRTASIRVPTGTADEPRLEAVPFDAPSADVPFEERPIQDETTFASFASRTSKLLRPFVADPLVEALWPRILERSGSEQNLGLRLAQGRHLIEGDLRNETLELPQSSVCQLPEFAWFTAHLFAFLPRFWTAHNEALASYRREHRLRNRAHPVPDLAEDDGWLEAPYWMWTADDPRRRAVFARQRGKELLVTDRGRHTLVLSLSDDHDAAAAAEQLLAASARGIKLRTRALATTLFARLLVSDLFLHGIGGARYDQVTDLLAEQFFGFSLPDFATVSATLRLPIAHPPAEAAQLREIQQQVRELKYHPERFPPDDGELRRDEMSTLAAAIAEKHRWVKTPKTPTNARVRHLAIATANSTLWPFTRPRRIQLERQFEEIEIRVRANAIFNSREYSFCLFPREYLASRLLDAESRNP